MTPAQLAAVIPTRNPALPTDALFNDVVLLYLMLEGLTSQVLTDSSNSKFVTSVVGGAGGAQHVAGPAPLFTGVNPWKPFYDVSDPNYTTATIPQTATLNIASITTPWVLEFWYNYVGGGSFAETIILVQVFDAGGGFQYTGLVVQQDGASPLMQVTMPSLPTVFSQAYSANAWHFYSIAFDGSANAFFHIDGIASGTHAMSNNSCFFQSGGKVQFQLGTPGSSGNSAANSYIGPVRLSFGTTRGYQAGVNYTPPIFNFPAHG